MESVLYSPLNERYVKVFLANNTKLTGVIDRMEFIVGNHVRVIDYKTGRIKSTNEIEGNTKKSTGGYKRQLVFYKLLLLREGRYDMAQGIVQFITPDTRGVFPRREFVIEATEIAMLEADIAQAAKEIRDLTFLNAPYDDPNCRYCELRRKMEEEEVGDI